MTQSKWLIIGANGALGTDLLNVFGEHALPATRLDFDLTQKEDMYRFIKSQPVTGVINTAAFHNVPLCEEKPEEAFRVNARGVKNLAELCSYLKLHLCHISTDYVFDGEKGAPYLETDLPSPRNTYGISKLAGEHMVQAYAESFTIIRTCGLYGRIPTRAKKGNFITSIIQQAQEGKTLKVVDDEIVTPTCTEDLAHALNVLLRKEPNGVFHINQTGYTSWFEFARTILDTLNFPNELHAISRLQFQSNLKRPVYSVLDCHKFEQNTSFHLANWKDALIHFLNKNRESLLSNHV